MERAGEAGVPTAGDAAAAAPPPVAAGGAGGGVVKGRSCKGCLFYSSVLRSRARGPVCVGVTRAIPQAVQEAIAFISCHVIWSFCWVLSATRKRRAHPDNWKYEIRVLLCAAHPPKWQETGAFPVPDHMVGEIELEAIQEGRNLSDFKYACVGYSIYLDDKENSTGKGDRQAQLPICVGVELLADRRASTKQAPAHLKKEAPQPRRYKPGHGGEDFLTKFQRNSGLVANGVARNLNKVGTYIKDTVGDIMFPYRKPPK